MFEPPCIQKNSLNGQGGFIAKEDTDGSRTDMLSMSIWQDAPQTMENKRRNNKSNQNGHEPRTNCVCGPVKVHHTRIHCAIKR